MNLNFAPPPKRFIFAMNKEKLITFFESYPLLDHENAKN